MFLPEENMQQNINNTSSNQPINNEYMDNNSLAGSSFNDMINAVKPIDNVQINNEPTVYQSSRNNLNTNPNFANSNNNFSFIPNFNNPNQERNDFIRKITSTIIEEDVDNNGNLYLKVIEPTGREQVYTGKEAVTMIKNYNRTYLDSNPGKVVDTSLIDRFQ